MRVIFKARRFSTRTRALARLVTHLEQLQQALQIARDIEREGDQYLRQLNTQSLQWRNKP